MQDAKNTKDRVLFTSAEEEKRVILKGGQKEKR